MVVRILEVMGFCLTRKRSASTSFVFSDFWSWEMRGASTSSESVNSALKAAAVGVSIMVRVATTSP